MSDASTLTVGALLSSSSLTYLLHLHFMRSCWFMQSIIYIVCGYHTSIHQTSFPYAHVCALCASDYLTPGVVDHCCNRLPLRFPFVGITRRFSAEKESRITLFIGPFLVHLSSLHNPFIAAEKEMLYRLRRCTTLAHWRADYPDV